MEWRPFRGNLLELLTDNPGTIEVENAYMKDFRQRLKSLVFSDSQVEVISGAGGES